MFSAPDFALEAFSFRFCKSEQQKHKSIKFAVILNLTHETKCFEPPLPKEWVGKCEMENGKGCG